MRLRPHAISLAAILFAGVFIGFHWILPVSPRAVLQLGDDAEFREFSPDSSTFVTARSGMGGKIGPVRVWDTQTDRERFAVEQAGSALETVLFSPDSRLLATRLQEKDAAQGLGDEKRRARFAIRLWDLRTGEEFATLRPPPYEVERGGTVGFPFCFTPDGQFLAFDDVPSRSGGRYFTRFWNIRARSDAGRIEGSYWVPQTGADSHAIVNFGYDDQDKLNRVLFWSSPANGPPRRLREFRIRADNGAFSPDLSTMASFKWPDDPAKPTEMSLWDMATGLKRCSFAYHEGDTSIQSLSFYDNGRVLVANGGGGSQFDWHFRTTLWDITATPKRIGSFSPQATLSSDGQWLAVPHENGAKLYRVAGMQQHGEFTVKNDRGPSMWGSYNNMKEYPSLSFSPNGRLLVVSGLFRTGQTLPFTDWVPRWIRSFVYSADDSVVRLWETDTGKQHAAFSGCRQVFFSPDGKTLATLHENGVLKLWAIPLHRSLVMSLALTFISWLPPILILRWVLGLSRRRRRA
jgi:WD40 repeat protein